MTWHRGLNGDQAHVGNKFRGGINLGQHLLLASSQLYHSIDSAQTFFIANAGLNSAEISQIIPSRDDHLICSTDRARGFISKDQGESWEQIAYLDSSRINCLPYIWFWETTRRLFKWQEEPSLSEISYSIDDGLTWNILVDSYVENELSTNHAFWYRETTYVPGAGTSRKFWRLEDQDSTARQVIFPDPEIESSHYLRTLSLGDRIAFEINDSIYIFDETPKLIHKIVAPCSQVFLGDPGVLYLADNTYYNFCNDRCYILPEGALDWQEIYPQDMSTGIPLYHSSQTFFTAHDGIIWVGLEGKGLFYATVNSGRFYPVQPQMPFPYPTTISFHKNRVWVGTDGAGIWTYPLPSTTSVLPKKDVFKIFPNPSSGGVLNLQSNVFFKTDIYFSLLDAAGRQIEQILLTPGQYWNLNFPALPRGIYFLQLRTESQVFGLKWVVGN